MFSTIGFLVLIGLRLAFSTTNTRCFPLQDGTSLCFLQPNTSLFLSWSDAQQWCNNNGATLPTPSSGALQTIYGNAVGYFGLNDQTMWLGGNATIDFNTWKWTDGSTCDGGEIENADNFTRTHAVVERMGNTVKIKADSPFESYQPIVQYQYDEIGCAAQWDSLWANGKCYAQQRGYTETWYRLKNYYDLAVIEDASQISTWLSNSTKYWIGLSCIWWNWHDSVSGTSYPFTLMAFDWNRPSSTSFQCVASLADRLNLWTIRDCSTRLCFICQKPLNATTTTPTITTTITAATTTTTKSTASNATSNTAAGAGSAITSATSPSSFSASSTSAAPQNPETSTTEANFPKAETELTIGLGVGLGLGFCLIFLIWHFTLTVFVIKIIRALQKINVLVDPDGNTLGKSKQKTTV